MSLKIKICGMTDAANMRDLIKLKPDFFGLIFYQKSPRFVSLENVKMLPLFESVKRVGVFVNESIKNILTIAPAANLAFAQLHGDESPSFCAELKASSLLIANGERASTAAEIKIIKAFSVDENFDMSILKEYESVCDYFLFDTKTSRYGGSGKSFDWTILQQFKINKPFFLSGGIGAENARAAVAACAELPIFALDINSRAEIKAGYKSPEIIEQIIKSL